MALAIRRLVRWHIGAPDYRFIGISRIHADAQMATLHKKLGAFACGIRGGEQDAVAPRTALTFKIVGVNELDIRIRVESQNGIR